MRTRKNKHNKNKNKKGGDFPFFNKPSVIPYNECNVNNLPTLTKMPDVYDMNGQLKMIDERLIDLDNMSLRLRDNYSKCCPKGFMGRKNYSPYCNQLDTTFRIIQQHKQDISGYYGDETDVGKIKQIMNYPVPVTAPYPIQQKPWYRFWGGIKTRKHRKRIHKRRTYRSK